MRQFRRPAAAALLAAATVLPAAAQEPPVLYVFNWSDYIAPDTIAKFEAETGIRVTYDVFDSNEVLEARLMAGASGFDLVVPTADFMERQIAAGVYRPLDKSLLPNLGNMDPALMDLAAAHDPDNAHSVIYLWGTTGIGINVEKVVERLGEDADLDTWSLVFDPETIAKLADCGVTFLDAPTEMIPAALAWLGMDPRSSDPADFDRAGEVLSAVRQHVRYYHSSQYINDLASGDICVAVGWSGDVFQARDRAAEAGNEVVVDYLIPAEGAHMWFDMLAIPTDARHPENAHKFIDFLMRPDIAAEIVDYVVFATANAAAMDLIDEAVVNDPAVFPDEATKANLWPSIVYGAREDRALNRVWTQVKTGR